MPFTPAAIGATPLTTPQGWQPHAIRLPDGEVRPGCLLVGNVDAYFQLSPRGAAWQALAIAEKNVAVDQACRWLNTLCWDTAIDCCDRDFAAAWEMAFSELALFLHQSPGAIISGPTATAQAGTFTKRQKLGDLEVEYAQFAGAASQVTSTGRVSTKAPLVLQKAPWLVDILGCWLKTGWGGSAILNRYRS